MSIDKDIIKHVKNQLQKAAVYLTAQVKKNLNQTGNPVRSSSGPTYRNENPSQPGEFPHKMLGDLQRSIAWEMMSESEARIGTNVEYGKYLELGTTNMAPRPFLRRTIDEESQKVKEILSKPYTK